MLASRLNAVSSSRGVQDFFCPKRQLSFIRACQAVHPSARIHPSKRCHPRHRLGPERPCAISGSTPAPTSVIGRDFPTILPRVPHSTPYSSDRDRSFLQPDGPRFSAMPMPIVIQICAPLLTIGHEKPMPRAVARSKPDTPANSFAHASEPGCQLGRAPPRLSCHAPLSLVWPLDVKLFLISALEMTGPHPTTATGL